VRFELTMGKINPNRLKVYSLRPLEDDPVG
jgi:hypothetical protein